MGCPFSNLSDDALNQFSYETIHKVRETIAKRRELFAERCNAIRTKKATDEDYVEYFNRVVLCVKRCKLSELSEDELSVLLAFVGLSRPEDEQVRNVLFRHMILEESLQLQKVINEVLNVLTTEPQKARLEDKYTSTKRRCKLHQRHHNINFKRPHQQQCSRCGHCHYVKHCIRTHHVTTIRHFSCMCGESIHESCKCIFIGPYSKPNKQGLDISYETSHAEKRNENTIKKDWKFERRSKISKCFYNYRTCLKEQTENCENLEDQVVPARERNNQLDSSYRHRLTRNVKRVRFSLPELDQTDCESSVYHRANAKRVQLNLNPIVTIY